MYELPRTNQYQPRRVALIAASFLALGIVLGMSVANQDDRNAVEPVVVGAAWSADHAAIRGGSEADPPTF